MKIRIGYKQPDMKNYLHIDPHPLNSNIPAYNGQLEDLNLDNIVDNNECTEIVAGELINYIPVEKVFNILNHVCMKLRHGGRIVVGGTDVRVVSLGVVNGSLDPKEFNNIVFADGNKSILPMNDMADILCKIGLTILSREFNGVNYLITAERP